MIRLTACSCYGVLTVTNPSTALYKPVTYSVQLSSDNKLVALTETATITGENGNSQGNGSVTNSITKLTMTEQGTTPPVPSDFNRPSICNAPNGNNQGQNDNSQGNELVCAGTIPNICL